MLRIRHTNLPRRSRAGLTIIELVVAIGILAVLFPLFAFVLSMYKDTLYLNDRISMDTDSVQALGYMEDNIRTASTFLATVAAEYPDAYGRHNAGTAGGEAWTYKGDSVTSRILMTRNYATTANPLSTGRQPVFKNTPDFNCTTQLYYQPQLNYVTIYFVKDGTLYRRILTDTTTALCAGSAQQQKRTCPPYIAVGSRHASCQAEDEVLTTNVSSFTVEYYQVNQIGVGTQIDPSYASVDPTILSAADYATATITKMKRGGTVTSTVTQRMTKVNQ